MRCFALTMVSLSVLVSGVSTALPGDFGDCVKDTEKCVDRLLEPRDIKEEPPPPQRYQYPQPDWMKDADKLKPLGNPRNYERPFGERFKDKAAYERAIQDIIRVKAPLYYSNSEAMKLAELMINTGWDRHDEPNVVVEDFLKFVDRFLQGRKNTTEARKKASQRVAKKPSALQEAVTDPELAVDAQPDLGGIASTLLPMVGAASPMVRGASVPSVPTAVRVPTPQMRAPAPVVRTSPSNSTITGN